MREILFKAKRIDNGEWVEGQYCYIRNPKTGSGEPKKHLICNGTNVFNVSVDPETVCQYTGLTDKKMEKAFENHKVYDPHENRVFTIKWDEELAAFFLMDDDGWMNKDIARLPYCEIIGSIHDIQK